MATESPLKVMKNAFYLTLKAFFVLKRFKFLCWLFGQVEKRIDLRDRLISKIISQPGKQIIGMHILPNMSIRKGN